MKKSWKVIRWIVLVALVSVIVLMITKPSRPAPPVPEAAKKPLAEAFEQKLEHLEQTKASGETGATEQFTPEEVNASLEDMSANAEKAMGPGTADDLKTKVVGVNFVGDEATGQFIVNQYGKDIYVTMSGHLSAKDGYANIELTDAKIGNLSVPVGLINPRLQQRLAEPDQRERLKLPDFIADLRVENGKLVIVEK
jgi:hypothetical protein